MTDTGYLRGARVRERDRVRSASLLIVAGLVVGCIFLVGGLWEDEAASWLCRGRWPPVRTLARMFAMQVESYQMLPSVELSNAVAHVLPPF